MTKLIETDPIAQEINVSIANLTEEGEWEDLWSMMHWQVTKTFDNNTGSVFYEYTLTDENFKNVKANATIDTASISTNNTDRDNHLKSAEFFNAEAHPQITFETDSLNEEVTGNLTINGVTKPVKLDVDFGGINVDPWGQTKAGFSFEGKIKRSDFGLNWNAALEAGGVMVSDEVKIAGELQFVKA